MLDRGFDVTIMIYPFDGHNLDIRKVIRKYYECAVRVSGSKAYNEIPCKQYNLRRIAVGSYFEKPNENTYEWYKTQIDSAVSNNRWIILMTHVGTEEHTQEQQSIFEQLVDYIATLSVDVLTVRDRMKLYGNTIYTGDYTGHPNTDIYSFITNTGEGYENKFRAVEKRKINNITPLKDFPLVFLIMTF